jgi:CheY-like chemotaxis protein
MGTQKSKPQLPTLLIIDDDAEWTKLLAAYFLGKYDVRVANLAADAIEIVRKEKPNVIIVDLVMPSMDGFGVIHRLNDASHARIPTILLTGWKTAEVEECAAAIGCTTVLGKPISLSALDRVVSSIVSPGAAAAAVIH